MLSRDYRKLYRLQDKALELLHPLLAGFYLTGGTALGRFYLHHRYSEDLDFFTHNNSEFGQTAQRVFQALPLRFRLKTQECVIYQDYAKYYIEEAGDLLKIELVNDATCRVGVPVPFACGMLDTPANILANKLTAIAGRDEPKDVFDLLHIALNYRFNWRRIFDEAKKKALINEIDVSQRLFDFPVKWLQEVDWHVTPPDLPRAKVYLEKIADDFLAAADNSLAKPDAALLPGYEA